MADNTLTLENAVVFIASRRTIEGQGFRDEDKQICEAMVDKAIMGEPFSKQEYKEAYKMLDSDYYKDQLSEGQMDFMLIPKEPIEKKSPGLSLDGIKECLTFHHQLQDAVVSVNHAKLARWILRSYPVACVVETREVLTYFNGKYIPNGMELIHRILVEGLTPFQKVGGGTVYTDHLFREVVSIIRGLNYRYTDAFDVDLDLINLSNGVYNWQTGEFREHNPKDYSRIQLPIVYDPNATCPNIDKLIEKVAKPEDQQKCYEFFAYCLYRGYPIEKAFILLGPGDTGKTRFLDVVNEFLGTENCSAVPLHDLTADRFASSDLYGAMANVCGDLDQRTLDQVDILKQLTSNKDKIRAQEKGKPAFDFINFAKLIFGANRLPPTKDLSTGFGRRWEILLFLHVFTKEEYDAEFLKSLTSPGELSGLFNKVVKLLPDLIKRNEFTNQMSIEEATTTYNELSNVEESFFDKFVHEVPGHFETKAGLHEKYRTYCKKLSKTDSLTLNKFGRFITTNITWLKGKTNSGTTIEGGSVAAWPNTKFDDKAFEEWGKSIV
jgi:putative DNA primase/helicase